MARASCTAADRYSLVDLQALEVHRREWVGELVGLDDVDSIAVHQLSHGSNLFEFIRFERISAQINNPYG